MGNGNSPPPHSKIQKKKIFFFKSLPPTHCANSLYFAQLHRAGFRQNVSENNTWPCCLRRGGRCPPQGKKGTMSTFQAQT